MTHKFHDIGVAGQIGSASMLLVVPQLVRPEFLLEIESYAAKS